MENNHDIDKKFNDASQSLEEPATFPGFDKVWAKVEEKLDKKQDKKRIVPIWIPYGIAASLMIGFGAFYFMNKKEAIDVSKKAIARNTDSPKVNSNVQIIDSTIKSNIEKEIAIPKNKNSEQVLAYDNPKIAESGKIEDVILEYDNLKSEVSPQKEQLKDTLKEKNIEEVVVMGYGIERKEAVTSSSTSRLLASTEKASRASFSAESLSGKVAGVRISSDRKKDGTIMIRGARSISYDAPLYIVDGIVAGNNSELLKILDPKKIKELKVIKGTEATALYGSRASEGVILVTTKGLSRSEKRKLKRISSEKIMKKAIEPKTIEPEKEIPKAGLLTAGEVNDFSKWNYWKDIAVPILERYKNEWKFFPDKRVSVQLVNRNRKPVVGEKVKLLNDKKQVVWEAVSDNLGNAELWINPVTDENSISEKYYLADQSGQIIGNNIKEFKNGQNLIVLDKNCVEKRTLDLAFVVDATGSMSDEISYLQSELLDVLKKVEANLKDTNVRYGSVFYRDQGDEYVTKKFDFSNKAEDLISFIKNQNAGGGGDYPEAVVEAMQVSIDELKWSDENSTKILFLILDAPPHHSDQNINKLYDKIKEAAKKGITIIPLAASGIDKQTEYLMRTFALLTNGTYSFLTNDSGIGNDHIKPTIDSYEVEKLNDLLLRLILQRATLSKCKNSISNDYLNKKLETEIKNQEDSKTILFPNPTKGMINIKSKNKIDELFIYDLAGKIIMRKENLPAGKNSIDITAYPQSIYLVRIRSQDKWETFKVIKN